MKTREQIYGKEAAEILRIVTTYHHIRHNQLLKLFPEKESKIENLLSYFVKQGRICYEAKTKVYSDGSTAAPNYEMFSAIWVLADFIEKVDYHSASDFPVLLVFLVDGEMYEVIYVATDKEALVTHALSQMENDAEKRLVIIDETSQIEKLSVPDVTAYCTVDNDTGQINYFTQRKEDRIG